MCRRTRQIFELRALRERNTPLLPVGSSSDELARKSRLQPAEYLGWNLAEAVILIEQGERIPARLH
jgi:hypothetical protein